MLSLSESAVWLSSAASEVSSLQAAHYFRFKFSLKSPIAKAVLRYSALGVVEPWVNGLRVSDDFFTPGWSDYRKRAYVCSYEVGERLQIGDNCLGVVLADGWAGAPFGPKGHAVAFAPRAMFVAELEVIYVDGSREVISTTKDWHWRKGAIFKNSIYNGETYDARKAIPDWASEVSSARGWKAVEVVPAPSIELTDKKCPPVRITEKREPIDLRLYKKLWIADFGQNLVGVMCIQLRNTKPGQKIVLKFAEMLQSDGSLYTENLRDAQATDVYYCKGGDEESYMPRFTFHGFRYAQVEGYAGCGGAEDLTACVLHNDLKRTGQFDCSDSSDSIGCRAVSFGGSGGTSSKRRRIARSAMSVSAGRATCRSLSTLPAITTTVRASIGSGWMPCAMASAWMAPFLMLRLISWVGMVMPVGGMRV